MNVCRKSIGPFHRALRSGSTERLSRQRRLAPRNGREDRPAVLRDARSPTLTNVDKREGSDNLPFVVVKTVDGTTLFFGDALNKPLLEAPYSVWGICAGMVQHLGAPLPDLHEIVRHVSSVAGTPAFGEPRMPTSARAGDRPVHYVRDLWPPLLPLLNKFCSGPEEWHIPYALALQEVFQMGKTVIAPEVALKIVIECAVSLAKVHPNNIFTRTSASLPA